MSRRKAIILAGFLLFGCKTATERDPFPLLGPLSAAERLALVEARAAAARTLAATVQVSMDSKELSGSFEVICLFEDPGRLHMSASKGLLFSSQPVFEVTFLPESYRLAFANDEGEMETAAGPLEDFPEQHPQMAELFWLREVMFRPGQINQGAKKAAFEPPESASGRATNPSRLRGLTREGARIEYEIDPATLRVEKAVLRPPDRSAALEIAYSDYRRVDQVFIPFRVEVRGPEFHMLAAVGELEANQPVSREVFESASVPRDHPP